MRNRLKISEKATKQLNHLSNRLDLRRNIICRIAVGKSLTLKGSVKDYKSGDSKGLEFNRVTLTGDQDLIFKTLIIQHEKQPIDEEIYFPQRMLRYFQHIDPFQLHHLLTRILLVQLDLSHYYYNYASKLKID